MHNWGKQHRVTGFLVETNGAWHIVRAVVDPIIGDADRVLFGGVVTQVRPRHHFEIVGRDQCDLHLQPGSGLRSPGYVCFCTDLVLVPKSVLAFSGRITVETAQGEEEFFIQGCAQRFDNLGRPHGIEQKGEIVGVIAVIFRVVQVPHVIGPGAPPVDCHSEERAATVPALAHRSRAAVLSSLRRTNRAPRRKSGGVAAQGRVQ